MRVEVSQIGTMAGTLAAAATYSSLVAVSNTASTVLDVATDTGGHLLAKGIGKLLGPAAELTTSTVCKIFGRTTSSAIQNYSPAVAGAVSAVVGVTTSLLVTGSEYVLRSAANKIQEKYHERTGVGEPKQLLEDVLTDDIKPMDAAKKDGPEPELTAASNGSPSAIEGVETI